MVEVERVFKCVLEKAKLALRGCRNMNVKGDSGEGSERAVEKASVILEIHIHDCEQNAGRNINVKGAAAEVSGGSEEHVIGNWRRGHLVIKW